MHNAVSIVFMTTLAAAPMASSTDADLVALAVAGQDASVQVSETRVVVLGPDAIDALGGPSRYFPPNRHVPEGRPIYAVNGVSIQFHAPPDDAIRFPHAEGGVASLPVERALLPLVGEADG